MKNQIDERQKQELFTTNHWGFLIMLYVSAIVILVQLLFMKATLMQLFGENIILLCGGIWAIGGYIKNGLWSRNNLEPSLKSNFMYSLIASFIATILFGVGIYIRVGSSVIKATTIGGFFIGILIIAFIVLTILGSLTKGKKEKIENKYKDIWKFNFVKNKNYGSIH